MKKQTFPYLERFTITEIGDRSVGEANYIPLQVGFFFNEPMELDDTTEASRLEFLEHIEEMLRKWWSSYSEKDISGIEVLSETADHIRANEDLNY